MFSVIFRFQETTELSLFPRARILCVMIAVRIIFTRLDFRFSPAARQSIIIGRAIAIITTITITIFAGTWEYGRCHARSIVCILARAHQIGCICGGLNERRFIDTIEITEDTFTQCRRRPTKYIEILFSFGGKAPRRTRVDDTGIF